MDILTFLEKLENIHKDGITKRANSDTIKDIATVTENELSNYEKFIPDFFCENGNEENIRKIYKLLRDGDFTESKVDIVDLYTSRKIYSEYYEGMAEFVKDVISESTNLTKESTNDKKYWENLEKAKVADSGFVKSIFGGEYNKRENVVLTEAVGNLEFLIDFIPKIGEMKKSSSDLSERALVEDDLTTESLRLLCDSVCNYCFESIKETMDTYDEIDRVINPSEERTVYKFKLFGNLA